MPTVSLGPADYEKALSEAGLSDITVFHRQVTGSTNDDARALAASSLPVLDDASAIVVAEAQTKGRGRGSNTWISPRGSIALTITVPGVDAARLGVLPLAAGTAVTLALRQLGAAAAVKWPNDVLIDGAKVCGILCESSLLGGVARVFIGIGVNVEADAVGAAVPSGATSLAAHGIVANRPALVADITARVMGMLRGGASGEEIVADWKAVSAPWWGEDATLVENETEKRVTLLDVNPLGQLLVRDDAGVLRSLVAGEVRRIRTTAA
jgi:BirA family biotin operon repressor/biotin-[acetyl-CoA-carboxylase] ligase